MTDKELKARIRRHKFVEWWKRNWSALIMIVLLGGCIGLFASLTVKRIKQEQQPTIVDVIDTSIVIKAAYEHKLEYFYIKTEFAKKDENASYYHTDYVGVDEYHTYYSLEYLSAVKDNELLQKLR